MTDPAAPPPDDGDDRGEPPATFALDEALERLKRTRDGADDAEVSTDGSTRMRWSSVTEAEPDAEPAPAPAPTPTSAAESSFRFDLGSALARLGDPSEDVAAPSPLPPTQQLAPSGPSTPPATSDEPGGTDPSTVPDAGDVTADVQADDVTADEPTVDDVAVGEAMGPGSPVTARPPSHDDATAPDRPGGHASELPRRDPRPAPDQPSGAGTPSGLPPRDASPAAGSPPGDLGSPTDLPRRDASPAAGLPSGDLGSPTDLPRRDASPAAGLPPGDLASPTDLPRRDAAPAAGLPSGDLGSPTDLPRRDASPAGGLPRREAAPPAGLPRRSAPPAAAAPSTAEPAQPSAPPASAPTDGRSVFAAANPAPTLPRNPQRMPGGEPAAPILPPSTALPTLPASNPSAPPPMVDDVGGAPAAPDIHAVRSYQLRAERDRRRGKVIGRSVMFVVLLAAAAAAAFLFGRDLLFPTQWDSSLTPLVDDVQVARGQDFTDTVPLRVVDDEEYVSVALSTVLGDDWAELLPQWRALGIANGGATADATTAAVVAWRPAIYDPEAETIYRASSADPEAEATEAAARLALEEAYEHQQGVTPYATFDDDANGVMGVSSPHEIASHAIDQALLVGSSEVPELDATIQTPLPVLYELLAIDVFGQPLLEAEAIDPAPIYGDDYPDDVLDLLAVDATRASFGLLPNEAQSLAPPTALGADGWRLVWQNRLPPTTVDRIASIVTADVYQPVMLGTSACFFAVFETANDLDGAELLTAMTTWVGGAPVEAQAIATPVSPTRVEVQACDPGTSVDQPVDAAGVTTLLDRQLARLG